MGLRGLLLGSFLFLREDFDSGLESKFQTAKNR